MRNLRIYFFCLLVLSLTSLVAALPLESLKDIQFSTKNSVGEERQAVSFQLDESLVQKYLANPTIDIPMPDGSISTFTISESPVAHPELQKSLQSKGLDLRTYSLQGVTNPSSMGRMQYGGELGFGAFITTASGDVWIHRLDEKSARYRSGYLQDITPDGKRFACSVRGNNIPEPLFGEQKGGANTIDELKTFRMAMVPHGTMVSDHSGNRTNTEETIITMTNYINVIFTRDLSVEFELISSNDTLTLPTMGDEASFSAWNNRDVLVEILDRNIAYLFSTVGSSGFDIGHVLMSAPASFFGGGAAAAGVCRNVNGPGGKADGGSATDRTNPLNQNDILADDVLVEFWTDEVAHEIGHQFGALHTFSSGAQFCGDQFDSSSSYEPGSGSTLMSYAGTCDGDDVQSKSDPYFHAISIQQMNSYINGISCYSSSSSGNSSKPVITSLPDRTIPGTNPDPSIGNTPVMLIGDVSDADITKKSVPQQLTYCWEQFDRTNTAVTNFNLRASSGPVIRSLPPVASPVRSFPPLGKLSLNTSTFDFDGFLGIVNRDFNFILTVRDNHVNGGLTEQSSVRLTVDSSKTNLEVTAPADSALLMAGQPFTVEWNPNDAASLAGASTVDILLFTSYEDGIGGGMGLEYEVLGTGFSTAGGTATVDIPNMNVASGALVVKASDNYFYDLAGNITTEMPPPPDVQVNTAGRMEVFGNGNGFIGNNERWKQPLTLVNNSTENSFTGGSIILETTSSDIVILAPLEISVPTIAPEGSFPFEVVFDVLEDVDCDATFQIMPQVKQNGNNVTSEILQYTLGKGGGMCDDPFSFAPGAIYCGSEGVNIPAGQTVTDTITVAETGDVQSLEVQLNLSSGYMGDMWLNLIHSGVSRSLFIDLGQQDCQAPFMDVTFTIDATTGIQQVCPPGSTTPITGDFLPNQSLNDFVGLDVNGNWDLQMIDQVDEDDGVLNSWCIVINGGNEPPTAELSTNAPSFVNSPFTVDIDFNEEVEGFDPSDLNVTNGTAMADIPKGVSVTQASVIITPGTDGDVTIQLPADRVTDSEGAGNVASNIITRTFDGSEPTVDITSNAPDFVSRPFDVDIDFNEEVTGFELSDLNVTNGVASNDLKDDITIGSTVTITPTADGEVTVKLPASTVADLAGNENLESNTLRRTFDETAPVPTLSSTSPNPTNGSFTVDISFNELVSGFGLSDLNVTNGVASNLKGSAISGSSFTITPIAEGDVTIQFPASEVKDQAGNLNTASNTITRTFDETAPMVNLSSTASNPLNGSFDVDIGFNEEVIEFELSDLTVTNGVASSNIKGLGITGSSFTITPTADGEVTVQLPASSVTDLAGNGNTASNTVTRTFDATAPTVILSSDAPDFVNGPFDIDVSPNEAVTGFNLPDLVVTNGSASINEKNGTLVTITPESDGEVTVQFPANSFRDLAGNQNVASSILTRNFDGTAPTVMLSSTAPDPVNSSFDINLDINESVTGFDVDDLIVTNGFLTMNQKGILSVSITPASDGEVTVQFPANSITDQAGNQNLASNILTRTFDGTAPGVTLSTTAPDPTSESFSVTATFTESINGFGLVDISVTNGSAGSLESGGGQFTFIVTPTTDGIVAVSIPVAGVTDTAGNENLESNELTIEFDGTRPTVELMTDSLNVTSAFDVSIQFSEEITGFDSGSITIGNGLIDFFAQDSASLYSVTVIPDAEGAITITIPENVVSDAAGNLNTSDQLIVEYDLPGDLWMIR